MTIDNYTRQRYFKGTTNWTKLPENGSPLLLKNKPFLTRSTLPMTSFSRITPLMIYIKHEIMPFFISEY